MSTIPENLGAVQQQLRDAARRAGRRPEEITLIAVSKTQPVNAVRTAHAAGARHFGENYLQDAQDKVSALADLDAQWHFIGRIQSNKTATIARLFDWVHTVDRLKIARRLSDARVALQAQTGAAPLNLCLQVNIDDDPAKGGIAPDAVLELAEAMRALPGLKLRGLMTILHADGDPARGYSALAALMRPSWDTLSMGMSGDFETAIEQGSTMVRVGTAIFGPRATAQGAADR
ncbi:MAG: YggS family pyridoxal phosphate-dependent enzyme [Pseudomonadota bacterium]